MNRPTRIAVRAWQAHDLPKPRSRRSGRISQWTLVFDTETTVDAAQALRIGCFRLLCCGRIEQEGLFHYRVTAAELALLRAYAAEHGVGLLSLDEFRDIFYDCAYRLRATVVGFNLPFDLSRLALDWKPARGSYAGGWSLVLWRCKDGQRENRFRPRLRIKTLNNRAALIEFAGTTRDERDGGDWRGRFLDLRTMAAALTDKPMSLDKAAEVFKTPHRKLGDIEHGKPLTRRYIDYLRRDVLVTQELLERLLEEYDRHPIELDASEAYSAASIGKAYLKAMGIGPPLERSRLSNEELGLWMSAFFGGRAECRIRGEIVPITYLDVRSMYPTVFSLMGLSRFLRAAEISSEDATEEARAFLAEVTLDDLFFQRLWPLFTALVEIEPDHDILPVRTRYGGSARSIGVNRFSSSETWWYSLPDVIASRLLAGKAPKVRRAVRLTASERQLEGLRAVELRGSVPIDPREGELFKRVIEERQRLRHSDMPFDEREALRSFLKTFANATVYGISAELNRKELSRPRAVEIHSRRSFTTRVTALERPGRYCFPPFATLVTGAARLILAMLERCVTDAGGCYAFMDTDSIAPVTDYGPWESEGNGAGLSDRADALSLEAIAAIVERFAPLNPYDFGGSIVEIEDENYADSARTERAPLYAGAISSKRYALVNSRGGGGGYLRKALEHGLGSYRPPQPDGEDLDR